MCGRYFQARSASAWARFFATVDPVPDLPPSYNKAPLSEGLVVRRHPRSGRRHLDVLRWGLVPHWAPNPSGAARLINARSETVAEKPAFRDAFCRRRCLIPMDGFYEWRKEATGQQPYAVALRSGEPMAAAGLWEGWRQPDGGWLRTYTILTRAARGRMATLHPRLPVILPPAAWEIWLAPATPQAVLRDLLCGALCGAAAEDVFAVWPISRRLNRGNEDAAALLSRDAAAQPPADLDDPPPPLGEGKVCHEDGVEEDDAGAPPPRCGARPARRGWGAKRG